jgi:transcriptional regulator with XRE-family HTH domain
MMKDSPQSEQPIFAKDYRSLLRQLLKRRQRNGALSWKDVADSTGVQSTYLSRFLSSNGPHMSADLLYQIAKCLQATPAEKRVAFLLREIETSSDTERREELVEEVRQCRTRASAAPAQKEFAVSEREMRLMLNPILILCHLALGIPRFAKDPKQLCDKFGLTTQQLQTFLEGLEADGWLKLSPDKKKVVSLEELQIHMPPGHHLTRAHQALYRQLFLAQCGKTGDSEKVQFMASFCASEKTLARVKEQFSRFVGELREQAGPESSENLYQMSFDFIRWL